MALLKPDEAAKYLNVSVQCLADWRWQHVGPPYVALSDSPRARIRYEQSDLEAWVEGRKVNRPESKVIALRRK